MPKKTWGYTDEKLLIQHYHTMTIKELLRFFPDRSAESINAKIKRLKRQGKIQGYKDPDTHTRALCQRRRNV